MLDIYTYDAIVVSTPMDFKRIHQNNERIIKYLPVRKVLFVGNQELEQIVREYEIGEKSDFVNEDDLIPFETVYQYMLEVMADILQGRELPRGLVGWYYQQFLKMQYSRIYTDRYYISWNGDTIPCRDFTMFTANNIVTVHSN